MLVSPAECSWLIFGGRVDVQSMLIHVSAVIFFGKSFRGALQEDWGELNTDKKVPQIFVFNITSGEVAAVRGTPEDCSVGQPVFTPDAQGVTRMFDSALASTMSTAFTLRAETLRPECGLRSLYISSSQAGAERVPFRQVWSLSHGPTSL